MKRCNMCGKEKPESEFYASRRSRDGLVHMCKDCTRKYRKRLAARNAYKKALMDDMLKDRNLKRHYDITLGDYEGILAAQGGVCAICGRSPEEFKLTFAVDHNHITGKVRGVVCPDCNRGLGGFHDDPVLVEKALEYLKKNAQ